jgi:4'-phosphopantetheinyl transferase
MPLSSPMPLSSLSLHCPPGSAWSPSSAQWPSLSDSWELARNSILVVGAPLDVAAEPLSRLAATLSPDELTRAQRFYFQRDRDRFVACRGWLRALLGHLLGIAPQQVAFAYSDRGKPSLRHPIFPAPDGQSHPRRHSLAFNLAHADSVAVIALSWETELGVDVERLRPFDEQDYFVEHHFSLEEKAQWRRVQAVRQTEAFFNYWTRKEACLKATGEGLIEDLSTFGVSFLPEQPAAVFARSSNEWFKRIALLHSFIPVPGYVGAIAALHADLDLHIEHRWMPGARTADFSPPERPSDERVR